MSKSQFLSAGWEDLRPSTPELDRAPTPTSISSPPTPTFQFTSPVSNTKSSRRLPARQLDYSSPLLTSSHRASDDERYVMRAFSNHAQGCQQCRNPLEAYAQGKSLCPRGISLVKDLKQYFYLTGGKPFSKIEFFRGRTNVQVEIPLEYAVVNNLFQAIDQGFPVNSIVQSKPEVHQSPSSSTTTKTSSRTKPVRRYTIDPFAARATLDEGAYEVRHSYTPSRRQRETYQSPSGRVVETRTPFDDDEEYVTKSTPRTTTTTTTRRESKPSRPTISISTSEPVVEKSSRKTQVQVHSDSESAPTKYTKSTRRSQSWDKTSEPRRERKERRESPTVRFYGYEDEPREVRRRSTYIPMSFGLFK